MSHNESKAPCYIKNIQDTVVIESPVHGFGLYAIKNIPKDTLLCKINGQIISHEDYVKFQSTALSKDIFIEKSKILEDKYMAMPFRTSYSFINHCQSISHIREEFCQHSNTLLIYANMNICANEEILATYDLENHIDVLGGFRDEI